jgi:hypothetical protein
MVFIVCAQSWKYHERSQVPVHGGGTMSESKVLGPSDRGQDHVAETRE